jgi:hypothetical protein
MKFQSTLVGAALVLAALESASGFAPSIFLVQRQQRASLGKNMVATEAETEIVNDVEIRTRKTREVSLTLIYIGTI